MIQTIIENLIVIAIGFLFLSLSSTLAILMVDNKIVSKEDSNFIMNLPTDELHLTSAELGMLSWEKGMSKSFIHPQVLPFSLFSYSVYGKGAVLRWSKLSRRIDEYYRIVKSREQ